LWWLRHVAADQRLNEPEVDSLGQLLKPVIRLSRRFLLKTYSIKLSEIDKDWLIIDADDIVLGRLATQVATFLRGKHKPTFTAHMDMGDNVIVLNAAKIKLTGQKLEKKTYLRHTGYMGGQRVTTMSKLMATRPEEVIMRAVKGMLPKTKLGSHQLRNLRVYAGTVHPHGPQQPKVVTL
jgi:large subunit ribosomal protein L13